MDGLKGSSPRTMHLCGRSHQVEAVLNNIQAMLRRPKLDVIQSILLFRRRTFHPPSRRTNVQARQLGAEMSAGIFCERDGTNEALARRDNSTPQGRRGRLSAIFNLQFGEDAIDVILDRAFRD